MVMRIACVYTVERGATTDKPLPYAMDIPFGMAIIATILQQAGHDVDLMVFSPRSQWADSITTFIARRRPRLFCLTAVSTQFAFQREIAKLVKRIDPSIFVILGGHHASLDPEETIRTPALDAICVGEGDHSVIELARRLADREPLTGIPHLWFKGADGEVEKNPPLEFDTDLDTLPYIDRKMWEPWIAEPDRYPSVLLGRGCPFRCTYCSAHAMARLSEGRFVRFRSPENIIGEISAICERYPSVDNIYLEVETIAHQKEAAPLFAKLAEFNAAREKKLNFGVNFTVTSTFIRNSEQCEKFLLMLRRANVVYLNIGLESGSERLRREVLRRPRYTNAEFLEFCRIAREHDVAVDLYVLIGIPGETPEDFKETVQLVRNSRPKMVQLSIFYPYLGTDLANVALEKGLVTKDGLNPALERARPALDLPTFSRRRVRLEYILFWFKAFRGVWPARRILAETVQGIIAGSPALWSRYTRLRDESKVVRYLRARYRMIRHHDEDPGTIHRPTKIEFTYSD
jgi:radical SAM superfamily enzyme YgiQ (UPF0313 family)